MRIRHCKRCGTQFQSDKPDTCLCPVCRKKAKQDSVVRSRVCRQCGKQFQGGPRAWYCPECREIRRKESAARRAKTGTVRPLGSVDVCEICGVEYIVNSARQRYCKNCADEAVRQNVNPKKAIYAQENKARLKDQQKERRTDRNVCVVCGAVFHASTATVTCSESCATELRKLRQRESDYRAGRRKRLPADYPVSSPLPQSGVTGVTWCRGKWQAKFKRKYIGMFSTVDEAAEAIRNYEEANEDER